MKVTREVGELTKVCDVEKSSVFYYRDRYWMRLFALGEAQDSVPANCCKTHIADLINGTIILIPDDVEVLVIDADCVVREVKKEDPHEINC